MTPEERVSKFVEEYGQLVEKYHVDFANYPMPVPIDGGLFAFAVKSTPIDIKDRPVPSPFVAQ